MTWVRDLAWETLDLTSRSSVSHQLARYALNLQYEMLPQEVIHQAKRSVLDTLACAVGAYEAPGRPICEDAVREIGGAEEATMFGSGQRTSALNATLVNSFLVRFLDYNDVGGGGHNSDSIPAILAISEREQARGQDFLSSTVIAYEIGARFSKAADSEHLASNGWCGDIRGGLSMPPALGKIMGLNEGEIANAIGICASHSLPMNVLDADAEENTMSKNLRFGFVSYNAILSCILARKGFTGPVRVVEGDGGWREAIFRREMDLGPLADFSGWRILETKHKSVAAHYGLQGLIASTIAIVKENDLKPQDISAVRITTSLREKLHTATDRAKKYPRNAESADHSAHFATAIAIKERAFGPDQVKPEKFTDPTVLDLIEKITVEVDPGLPRKSTASTTEITTNDGRRFQKHVEGAHGRLEDPLTDAEIETKFRHMADPYMTEKQIRKIFDTVWNLESIDNINTLTGLMVFGALAPRNRY